MQLAKIFKTAGANLYIVGGYVRDSLLGKQPYDLDICSELQIQKVKEILKNSDYKYKTKNSTLGTAVIECNNRLFEYTCFRTEKYAMNGTHTPTNVEFVKDIKVDAARRDFYVNALYFDIINNKVVDPLNKGLTDLENKRLTVIPRNTCAFCEDAARMLRLIKFSAIMNFSIDNETMNLAKKYSILLNNITPQRFKKELGFIALLDNATKEKVNKLFQEISPGLNTVRNFKQ